MTNSKITMKLMLVLAGISLAGPRANAERYEELTKRFANGDKMHVVAATYFGGADSEEFISAGQLPDGTIVAFGNATGPDFPAMPTPAILGHGKHQGLNPFGANKNADKGIDHQSPDLAGMMVFYDEKLSRELRVVRFDWGVASLSLGALGADGQSLYVAGRCTAAFRDLARSAASFNVESLAEATAAPPSAGGDVNAKPPKPGPGNTGPYTYNGVTCPGDVFIARLSPNGEKIEWVWLFEGLRTPPDHLWTDRQGSLYFDVAGMRRITSDGRKVESLNWRVSSGRAKWLAVDPSDGGILFGGDRNTNTGFQPWRQPFLYKFDHGDKQLWKFWEWDPHVCACGGSGNGLCSDSSPQGAAFGSTGDLVVLGWSDGGNSVFTRQPTDLNKSAGSPALGMESWGMKGASSLAYMMVIDPKTFVQKAFTLWLAYVPDNFTDARFRSAPNGAGIDKFCGLADGSIGFSGGAATGLIQTPNAFYKYPGDGRRYGGEYVAVMTGKMNDLLFSSYVPGCRNIGIAPSRRGMLVVSCSFGHDKDTPPTPSPVFNAIQPKKQGALAAHIMLLELP